MAKDVSLEEYKKAYRKIRKEKERKGFIIHLIGYVIGNIGLIVWNFVYVPEHIWFFWPLIFWGLGLTYHYLEAVRFLEREFEKDEALAEIKAKRKK